MNNERRNTVYKGRGFILKTANKEYLESRNRRKTKNTLNDRRKNIFNKYNPVVLPLLGNYKGRKGEQSGNNDINLLNESEINSFLMRNKAFRLTWSCIIDKIQKEIDIQISKNLSNVFEEIYAYSVSNHEFLPLILMTAGTNVADHEIIIDAISYELKKWNYNKGRRRGGGGGIHRGGTLNGESVHPATNATTAVPGGPHHGLTILKTLNGGDDVCGESDMSSGGGNIHPSEEEQNEEQQQQNEAQMKRDHSWVSAQKGAEVEGQSREKKRRLNGSFDEVTLNQFESYDESDVYLCSLNSSTSKNVNAAIYNIYSQLYREYKTRAFLAKYRHKSGQNGEKHYPGEIRVSPRRMGSNDSEVSPRNGKGRDISSCPFIPNGEGHSRYYKVSKNMVSIDKLIELYWQMSEIEKKREAGKDTVKTTSWSMDLSDLYSQMRDQDDPFLQTHAEMELYSKQNDYMDDGRKKIRVIILIHDCEYFNINVLNGILNVLINLRIENRLCLSVILGVSTPSFFFSRITTPDTQSKLRIKTIDILNNKVICERVCDDLLFGDTLPFIVTFRTIHAIKLLLHKNNQSISHLVHILYILTKEFYDNNLFSFLSLPMGYYLGGGLGSGFGSDFGSGLCVDEAAMEYSPYTFVRSNQKSFSDYSKFDMRALHRKIICLCYSANIYYAHLSFLKRKYSSILVQNYFTLHGKDSIVQTPTNSDTEMDSFTLKRKPNRASVSHANEKRKSVKGELHRGGTQPGGGDATAAEGKAAEEHPSSAHQHAWEKQTKWENDNSLETSQSDCAQGRRKKNLDRSLLAWKFKASTINWWFDHPFKDLVYSYKDEKLRSTLKSEIDALLDSTEEKSVSNLHDVDSVQEINKYLCEVALPRAVLQLIERKYAFNIAINLIDIIIKCKNEYRNSIKRVDYFRTLFLNFEKVKWKDNRSILYIEEIYKVVENDVKKCVSFLIDIVTPYCFKNQEVLLAMLKEFKSYYTRVYPLVYNLEDYLFLLKEKEKEKDLFINDDFAKFSSEGYSFSFSVYYSLLFKLDDLIEMVRTFLCQQRGSNQRVNSQSGSTSAATAADHPDGEEYSPLMGHRQKVLPEKKKAYKRYLTIQNSSLKGALTNETDRTVNVEDMSNSINLFLHEYLNMLLLPPLYCHPLAYEMVMHKPDKEFTDLMTRDIKTELLQTLCYTNPYKTGSLICSCCSFPENKANTEMSTNIVGDGKVYLNPYYDNVSTLEDLINVYRIYERCNKTLDLYNFFILFVNVKVDGTAEGVAPSVASAGASAGALSGAASPTATPVCTHMLQEYYLKFIIAVNTFCSFLKILKPPNVSALLKYTEKCDNVSDDEADEDGRGGTHGGDESIGKFLSDIRKTLQGCTSKKLLFGKLYYNRTIISREMHLQRLLMQYNADFHAELHGAKEPSSKTARV
ncbi:hypothetical protein C922_03381 [Plasmodium inui San Antonio 1]|uniref:Origin recognition complex subunit 3 N-terminal domain-containing protein n=1 Tax=Plasmodium inui San Antonio 1 TaxID=1237626 RepID=W7ALI8_9APIC|nr:hypothetical protein C922_03381 [Plasmodium inui San Antonio 1]EUD66186.1 hypothetical protein C922_03381 [Plasmodium inui San Antonio 1]